MNALIESLKAIESDESIQKSEFLTDGDPENLNQLVQNAVGLACENLIDNSGHCNWKNIKELDKNGFNVSAGEQDSFGWLTGVIHTAKGKIVYG